MANETDAILSAVSDMDARVSRQLGHVSESMLAVNKTLGKLEGTIEWYDREIGELKADLGRLEGQMDGKIDDKITTHVAVSHTKRLTNGRAWSNLPLTLKKAWWIIGLIVGGLIAGAGATITIGADSPVTVEAKSAEPSELSSTHDVGGQE